MFKFMTPLITIALLGGVALDQSNRDAAPPGIESYHVRVQQAETLIPYNIGNWVGTDTPIRQEALNILDANSTISRVYRDLLTGQTATLLLVQCADARSLLGHYPPVCYPSQGWSQLSSAITAVPPEFGSFEATEYAFGYELSLQSNALEVLHFTVLPDGRMAPNMDLLDVAARDRRYTFYGGASIQFIVNSGLTDEGRHQTYEMLFQAAAPWIAAVQAGLPS